MLQAILARDQVRLLRACTSVVLLYLFFSRGGAGIGWLTEDLVASEVDGLRLYHRTRKGQRGVSAERKLLCHLPPTAHTEVIQMLLLSDTTRHTLSGGKYPTARLAINTTEKRYTDNTTKRHPTRSLDGSPRSLRQCKNAPHTVSARPRTPYAKGLRQPPTTSALRYKRLNTSTVGQRSPPSSSTTSTRPPLHDDHSGSSSVGSHRGVDNL
jgi:hypothetical protein